MSIVEIATTRAVDRTREPDLRFAVRGVPGPQGSKDFKGFSRAGHAILVESSKLVKPWRQDVAVAAVDAMDGHGSWRALTGPVHIVIEFFLPRPKSQPRTRRTLPITSPDLDKLVRATGDALKTAGVYRDDALVTDITTRKRYVVQDPALGHSWELPGAGAVISVFALTEDETWADQPLDLAMSTRFPVPTLPQPIVDYAGHTPMFEAGSEFGQVFTVSAGATDGQAMQVARRVLAIVDKRESAAGPAVTLVIEGGVTRLSSVTGRPDTTLQATVSDIATRGPGVGVSVLLADAIR